MALDVLPCQELDDTRLEPHHSLQEKTVAKKQPSLLGSSHEQPNVNMEEVDYESLPTDKLLPHLMAGGAAGI